MKKLLAFAILLLTLTACTDNQKEKIGNAVDEVTGISKVRETERIKKKVDSINNLEVQRIEEMNEEF